MKAALLATVLAATLSAPAGHARTVDNLDAIVREMEIAKEVFRSSIGNSISEEIRISSVDAQYLAGQGVLISIDVVRPWFKINKPGQHPYADFYSNVEIPEIVQKIFMDLRISVPPYDPEELDELRELRSEQRELRKEQRELRAKTRVKRRELVRADDTDEREEISEDIVDLEQELRAVDAQIDALNTDLDAQYKRLSEARSKNSITNTRLDIDAAVAETACNYGSTFKTLGTQKFLTIAVSQRNLIRYFVFKLEHIGACRRGDIDPGELLDRSDVYET
ncbi:MAG: hypothetical protein O7E57_17000 [Gammaproteobacteria bacterium]|nr:hypothetical protein [Gammaproteobacteria bacterium]MCZ6854532.1 hypothetical protein [Gammaproteobacteria bacterium]